MSKPFSVAFKQRMVQRLTGKNAVSATQLARETGVAQQNLSRWLRSRPRLASGSALLRLVTRRQQPPKLQTRSVTTISLTSIRQPRSCERSNGPRHTSRLAPNCISASKVKFYVLSCIAFVLVFYVIEYESVIVLACMHQHQNPRSREDLQGS